MLNCMYQVDYIPKDKLEEARYLIDECEIRSGNPCVLMDKKISTKVLYKYHRKDDEPATAESIVVDCFTGLYKTLYLVSTTPSYRLIDSDYMRESAYQLEDAKKEAIRDKRNIIQTDEKNLKERFWEYQFRARDELIDIPEAPDKSEDLDYWFVSLIDPERCKVIKIDVSGPVPVRYDLTKEYYAPKYHGDNELTQEERDWATVMGWEGDIRHEIKWFMETFPTDEEKLAFANGMNANEVGTTSDAQIGICPDCGRPVHMSPNQHSYTDKVPVDIYSGEEAMKTFLTPAQLTCSHCGANLESCFDFDEIEIPAELVDTPAVTKEPIKGYKAWFTNKNYKPAHFTNTPKPEYEHKTYYDVYKFEK